MRSQVLIKIMKESQDAKFHRWSALPEQILRIRIHVYSDILHCHLLVPEVCLIEEKMWRCIVAYYRWLFHSIASVAQHALVDMQCKISQLQAVSNACISDKDDGASELVKIIKLGRFIRQVSDWSFISEGWMKLFRSNMRVQMGQIPALWIRSGLRRGRGRVTVSGTEWDRRLSVWRCYSAPDDQEPDPSNTE